MLREKLKPEINAQHFSKDSLVIKNIENILFKKVLRLF